MRPIMFLATVVVFLAGCSTPPGAIATAPVVAPAPSTSAEPSLAAFYGRWIGATERGGPIEIVLAEGSSRYVFRGAPVPVTGATMRGNSLVLTVGKGGGTVALTPLASGRLAYDYRLRGERASAVLVRT